MTTSKSNNLNLPIELINSIMSYMSSPVASIFKKDWLVIDAFNHLNEIMVDIFGEECLINNDTSFAHSFFLNRYIGDSYLKKSKYHEMDVEEHFSNSKIYNYSNMDEDYVNTLNEYYINH